MSALIADGFLDKARSLGKPLDLAGPYLSLGVLRGLRPRRVLVDVEAWAASTIESLVEVYDGLVGCEWRHLGGLHAKLAVGPQGALVGSANFTRGGMERNVELGVRLDDPTAAQGWFETRWAGAEAFDRRDLERYATARPSMPPRPSTPTFRPDRPSATPSLSDEDRAMLLRTLRRFPDREAADVYFELLRKLYDDLGVVPDDPRLSLNAIREQGRTLRVNVNNRVVLTWYARRPAFLGFTVGAEEGRRLLAEDPNVSYDWEFDLVPARPHALHLRLARPEDLAFRPRSWQALIEWAGQELTYAQRHPGYRRYDASAASLALSPSLRRDLLDKAFGVAQGSRAGTNHPAATPIRGKGEGVAVP